LPQFANDTKDLANDAARKEKMNLDVIDEPTGDEKVIEMVILYFLLCVRMFL